MIIDCLINNSERFPDKPAFIYLEDGEEKETIISFSELKRKVQNLSIYLNTKNLNGKNALLIYNDTIEFIISFLACQYIGIIPVPIFFLKAARDKIRITNVIKDSNAAGILTTSDLHDVLKFTILSALEENVMDLISTDHPEHTEKKNNLNLLPDNYQLAFIQYTSGSTGKPKGVKISKSNLIHNQKLIKDAFACNEDSMIFSWLPFHHDMGLIGNFLHAVYNGCTCVLMSPFHFLQKPQRWLNAISKYKITHSGGPNFAFDMCIDKITGSNLSKLDLSSWKVAYNGSEPVKYETIKKFTKHFKSSGFVQNALLPCYGLAEATLLVAAGKRNRALQMVYIGKGPAADGKVFLTGPTDAGSKCVVSCGTVSPEMEIKIISPKNQKECDELETGEICISGESVTPGYWNKISDGFFYNYKGEQFLRTGDLGFLYKNELFVNGRLKEMLIVRGGNYYPYDIEQAIATSNFFIESNGVVVFNSDNGQEEVICVIEVKRQFIKDLDTPSLIASIDKLITGSFGFVMYDIVLTIPFGIPRTTSGKLQRIQSKENYDQKSLRVIGSKLILAGQPLWKDKNGSLVEAVLKNSDFETISAYLMNVIENKVGSLDFAKGEKNELMEMGIDSLKALEILNTINKDLNININAAKIFQDNTFSGLILAVENMLWLKNGKNQSTSITL